jgi:mRNA interferase MazF
VSITVCGLTSVDADAPISRPTLDPTEAIGLRQPSRVMVDKIATVPRRRLGSKVGVLGDQDMVRLNRALFIFLGLAGH